MSELKPCPFCGSEQPQDSKDDGNVPYEFGMSRSCNSCSAAVNLGWNTRPIEDALNARIAELEADNKKAFDLVRKLRMYCIWANWDNPDTEDEFNEFDVEVCKWLSKFMEREE